MHFCRSYNNRSLIVCTTLKHDVRMYCVKELSTYWFIEFIWFRCHVKDITYRSHKHAENPPPCYIYIYTYIQVQRVFYARTTIVVRLSDKITVQLFDKIVDTRWRWESRRPSGRCATNAHDNVSGISRFVKLSHNLQSITGRRHSIFCTILSLFNLPTVPCVECTSVV